jgi:hypothetical protein
MKREGGTLRGWGTTPCRNFSKPRGNYVILKISEGLSLRPENGWAQVGCVIGASKILKGMAAAGAEPSSWHGRGKPWAAALFLLAVALLFGGAAGRWFDDGLAGGGLAFRFLQLATGSVAMGLAVAVPGSLGFGRNPVRWGIGMPILAYLGGVVVALLGASPGGLGLLYGAPLFLGLAIAAGVMGTFLIDGVFPRPRKA